MPLHVSRVTRRAAAIVAVAIVGSALAAERASAQSSLDSVTVRVTPVRGTIYMLDGQGGFGGGNVVASVGPDGVLLVDDMFAAMAPKIDSALAALTPLPVRLVIDTHFHGDHVQGNAVFGRRAMVVAQERAYQRLARQPGGVAYPVVTFVDSVRVRFNGDTARVIHLPNAHTDGDALVYFEGARVLHTGDTFFFGMFPAVYREGGGDVRQLAAGLRRVVAQLPADTRVVPGHGELASMDDLRAYVAMLDETIAAVERGVRRHEPADAIERDPVFRKYEPLGRGGAQTLTQYVAMLVKLLSPPSAAASPG